MSCTCRVASLRTFLNGLSQVHKIEASSSTPTLPFRLPSQAAASPSRFAPTRQTRPFHVSRYHLQEDSVAPGGASRAEAAQDPPTSSSEQSRDTSTALSEGKSRSNTGTSPSGGRQKRPRVALKTGESRDSSKVGVRKSASRSSSKQTESTAKPAGRRRLVTYSPDTEHKKEPWRVQKEALKEKFPEGWNPRRRLSPDALAGIRALNSQFPDIYTTSRLAEKFEVSAEAIRRILKSKWQPSVEEEQKRQERWHRRGISIWEDKAALGHKPPKRWREEGISRDPEYHNRRQHGIEREKELEEEEREKYREFQASVQKPTIKVL